MRHTESDFEIIWQICSYDEKVSPTRPGAMMVRLRLLLQTSQTYTEGFKNHISSSRDYSLPIPKRVYL